MKLIKRLFPVGTRSLLWGVHQFLWHPYTVYRAWCDLYGRPTWREAVCILIHDWGYWGSPNMDGPEGERHPEWGAKLAGRLFGRAYHDLVLFHSRHYVKRANATFMPGVTESMLCWADKLSVVYDTEGWYLFRARLSGELAEYRQRAAVGGFVPLHKSDAFWFRWLMVQLRRLAMERRGDAAPYMPNG